MKNLKKISILLITLFLVSSIYAQDKGMKKDCCKESKSCKMDHSKMMKNGKMMENSIIRKGVIDLSAIDKNKDGKVFQDMMDWNVISDKAGKCPICEMKLKEVTLEQAKKNLLKHNYKVK